MFHIKENPTISDIMETYLISKNSAEVIMNDYKSRDYKSFIDYIDYNVCIWSLEDFKSEFKNDLYLKEPVNYPEVMRKKNNSRVFIDFNKDNIQFITLDLSKIYDGA